MAEHAAEWVATVGIPYVYFLSLSPLASPCSCHLGGAAQVGLRPGYDWALSVLAVRVVIWKERMAPGLHQLGGLVEWAGVLGWVEGPGF